MRDDAYWNSYYASKADAAAPVIPSQFAVFVAGELIGTDTRFVEIGCGNGRDSLFFARHGFKTIGIDASSSAIDLCTKSAPGSAKFICSHVDDDGLADKIVSILSMDGPCEDVTVYARFFIHAIDANSQRAFLRLSKQICGNGRVAVEFRTNRDAAQAKVTPAHYRRFVHPLDFMTDAREFGFYVEYFVEGFGYAKFRSDDAHVARFVLRPYR